MIGRAAKQGNPQVGDREIAGAQSEALGQFGVDLVDREQRGEWLVVGGFSVWGHPHEQLRRAVIGLDLCRLGESRQTFQ